MARGSAPLTSDPTLFAGVDLVRLKRSLAGRRDEYASAQPFPHIVLDDFLEPDRLAQAAREFGDVHSSDWIGYVHFNEKKFSNPNIDSWGPTLRSVAQTLNSPEFVQMLSELTGIDGLIADEGMEGGGLHQSLRDGFLNVHADYTVHPLHPTWRRRVNLLLYFNDEWPAAYGGALELWSTDMSRRVVTIEPRGNRCRDLQHGERLLPRSSRSDAMPARRVPQVACALLLHRRVRPHGSLHRVPRSAGRGPPRHLDLHRQAGLAVVRPRQAAARHLRRCGWTSSFVASTRNGGAAPTSAPALAGLMVSAAPPERPTGWVSGR